MSFWPFAIFENNKKVLSLITKIRPQIANYEPLIRTLNKVYQNTQKHYFSQSKEVARLFKYSKRTLFSFSDYNTILTWFLCGLKKRIISITWNESIAFPPIARTWARTIVCISFINFCMNKFKPPSWIEMANGYWGNTLKYI